MRRLNKKSFSQLRNEYPVAGREELSRIVAGEAYGYGSSGLGWDDFWQNSFGYNYNGYNNAPQQPTWDCMFNAFIYYYKAKTGIAIDKEKFIAEYVFRTEQLPDVDGGANIEMFMFFISTFYNVGGTRSDTPTYTNDPSTLIELTLDNSGISHIVNITGARRLSDDLIEVSYWDATIQCNGTTTILTTNPIITNIQGYINLYLNPGWENNSYDDEDVRNYYKDKPGYYNYP